MGVQSTCDPLLRTGLENHVSFLESLEVIKKGVHLTLLELSINSEGIKVRDDAESPPPTRENAIIRLSI
ncbi:hypothetical protein K443DRAFT_15081 [Laccaria amethystina LaAM-08-1]|uniref:Uncharacterized protein n=1 Tax=Laccaria amethystina LaAM-08-1 TaxID=1095629 RepID=A0A0C9WH53_9AGAR|nr:hypothetical protein K443DRAFT_15081 [Laccaria amethystina LaAM-08-1]